MSGREIAYRMFSTEINEATYEIKGEEEKSPSYQVTRLGAMVNRVLVCGVITEKDNIGSEEEPMWRGRVQDHMLGNVYINVGRYQPEASAAMADLEVPAYIAVVGKLRSYTTQEGKTYVSIRPESVTVIDEATRNAWMLEAARSTWDRLVRMRRAITQAGMDGSIEDFVKAGLTEAEAKGVSIALDVYGTAESAVFLKSIQSALRTLLPGSNVDLGLPEDMGSEDPDEMDMEIPGQSPASAGGNDQDSEDVVVKLIEELDEGDKGALRDELERRAENEGIPSMELEIILDKLVDDGRVYEPDLRHIRLID